MFVRGKWRRGAAAGLALTMGAALVAGCGSTEEEPAAAPSGSGTAAFPVSITHKLGTTTVDAEPKRIVALSDADLDALLLLGVQPIAVGASAGPDGITSWAAPKLTSKPTVLEAGETGYKAEEILKLNPDLVLAGGDYYADADHKALSPVVPTTAYETGPFEDPWQVTLRQVAKLVGKSAEGEKIITDVEAKVAKVRTDLPEIAGKTFSLSQVFEAGTVGVLRSKDDAGVKMLNDFGMKLAPAVESLKGDEFAVTLSLEKVGVLDADVTLVYYTEAPLKTALEGNTLFGNLPSVKRGSYLALEEAQFSALRTPTPLSVTYLVENVVPLIAKAAKAGG